MKLTRRTMLGIAVAGFAALAGLPALPASANGSTPAEQAAYVAANRFLELVRNGGSRDSFADLLGRHVSVQQIAMFALGKYRRAMPPKQRQTYVSLVNDMLLDNVTRHGKQVRGQAFVVTGSQGNIVKGYIQHASGKQTAVDLRMVENRVADVRVQGIWMGFMLRQEFNRVIDSKGGDVSAIFAYLKNGETH
jgi:ABC-type transporter MlaC component